MTKVVMQDQWSQLKAYVEVLANWLGVGGHSGVSCSFSRGFPFLSNVLAVRFYISFYYYPDVMIPLLLSQTRVIFAIFHRNTNRNVILF